MEADCFEIDVSASVLAACTIVSQDVRHCFFPPLWIKLPELRQSSHPSYEVTNNHWQCLSANVFRSKPKQSSSTSPTIIPLSLPLSFLRLSLSLFTLSLSLISILISLLLSL